MSTESRGMLIVISGPAGSGKGTVVKELRSMLPDLGLSVSATTRSPRPGEEPAILTPISVGELYTNSPPEILVRMFFTTGKTSMSRL